MKTKLLSLLALWAVLGGCTATTVSTASAYSGTQVDRILVSTNSAVDKLVEQVAPQTGSRDQTQNFNLNAPIIVATLVNVDSLESSSRLGRSLSEVIASRLTQRGFRIIEVKLRGSLYVKKSQGELLLSREMSQIVKEHMAPAVVVGTYAPAEDFVVVNIKLVSADDQVVLAASSYGLELDWNLRSMLKNEQSR